ncbi:MAG: hypothetical protein H6712_35345 [Myxococcales bacterium]|nr:hypothetical protein [Myxococcales bacterium]MCB9719172.1 hypothetical protein [Myxococcales bacterium]
MTEDRDRAKAPGSSREGPPPWLGALAEACGDELHRYCGGVLGDAEAERVAVLAFAQAVEQEARAERAGPVELEPLRATVLAMAHNRCVAEGRQERGSAPQHSRGSEDERRAMQALARLRPIGRDVSILRHGLGLRWDAMQRVCGEPPARLVLQVCRAWRRMAHLAQGRPGQPPVRRPGGRALSEREEDWAAIREDARAHAELRAALRRAVEHGPGAAPGWVERVWPAVEELRAREREAAERERQRLASREAEAEARAAAERAEEQAANDAQERAAKERAAKERRARAEAEERAAAEHRRAGVRRATMGAMLVVLGLMAAWLAMR